MIYTTLGGFFSALQKFPIHAFNYWVSHCVPKLNWRLLSISSLQLYLRVLFQNCCFAAITSISWYFLMMHVVNISIEMSKLYIKSVYYVDRNLSMKYYFMVKLKHSGALHQSNFWLKTLLKSCLELYIFFNPYVLVNWTIFYLNYT